MDSVAVVKVILPLANICFISIGEFSNSIKPVSLKITYNCVPLLCKRLVNSVAATGIFKNACHHHAIFLSSFHFVKYPPHSIQNMVRCVNSLTYHEKVCYVKKTYPPSADITVFVNLTLVVAWKSQINTEICNIVFLCLITFTVGVQIKKWLLIFVKLNQRWGHHF